MNGFSSRKIRKNIPQRKPVSEKTKQQISTFIGALLILAVVYYGGRAVFSYVRELKILNIFTDALGVELIADEDKHTNILLLGVGGEGHDGKDLTDTIIVASIDHVNNRVALLSLPRDLYVESSIGGHRVNRLYEQGKAKWGAAQGLDFTRSTFQKILGIPLHYVVKIDFAAFVKAVDGLGGVPVYVDEDIYDTQYPLDGTYEYTTFSIKKGLQHMDGATALKYVRSRKTSSDFDRSKRQQQVLVALKKRAENQNIFGKANFIKDQYYSLTEHVETTFSIRELLGLAEFFQEWEESKLKTAILNDDPSLRGGILYTPLRELYGGAYVLLPAGDAFDPLHQFARVVLYGPDETGAVPIALLNTTKRSGLAGKTYAILNRFGFNIEHVGNGRTRDNISTQWYIKNPELKPLVAFLQELIPGTIETEIPAEYLADEELAEARIILELGQDSLPIIEKLDIFKNVVSLVAPPPPLADSTTTEETSVTGTSSQVPISTDEE